MAALAGTASAAPKNAEIEDGELVRRVRRGDERAFEQLYHRYHRRITAYIHGMVHDHARAEDVSQDVFVSALRRMRETDRPIAFKPWIYEIAKNACIDQFRRSRRAEEISYDADEGMGAADYGRLVCADAVPENELESKQSIEHLRGAFGGLSETHHEILVMRELEGLSYREIGERLGMSRPSVESTLFRARRRLTEEYEELVSGARCQRIQTIIAGASGAAPGARDQRRLARHVSHCQPCRRQARLAGLEIPVTPDRAVRQRIALFLPLPLFLRKRWSGEGTDVTSIGSTHVTGFAQWSAQLGSTVDPGWLKAAATAVTVAVAGTGAGLAGNADLNPSSASSGFSQLITGIESGRSGSSADSLQARTGSSVSAALRVTSTSTSTSTSGPAAGADGASALTAAGGSAAAEAGGQPATGTAVAEAPEDAAAATGADELAATGARLEQATTTAAGETSSGTGAGAGSGSGSDQADLAGAFPEPAIEGPSSPGRPSLPSTSSSEAPSVGASAPTPAAAPAPSVPAGDASSATGAAGDTASGVGDGLGLGDR